MLKQLYIDNFRAFVNFTLPLQSKQLLLGRNGGGKSSVLDALRGVRQFVVDSVPLENDKRQVFTPDTLTRWQSVPVQVFELEIGRDNELYQYRLEIEHRDVAPRSRVALESLKLNGKPLFEFKRGHVRLFRDDFSEGPDYPFDWGRSALATIQPRNDNTKLSWFKERLARVYTIRMDAPNMSPSSQDEALFPLDSMTNFVAWYRQASGDGKSLSAFLAELRQALPGLDNLNLEPLGRGTKLLRAEFAPAEGSHSATPVSFDLDELSDGQRALIGLYALLHFALKRDVTVLIDEPDNYVSLDEIQPWLVRVMDQVDEFGAQVVFVSHHPELLDLLARDHGVTLEREGCGPVRVKRFQGSAGSRLSPSEQIARGWDRE